ncbi:MAG: acetamidase/formamidase family protein [Trueperaceae bacterium]
MSTHIDRSIGEFAYSPTTSPRASIRPGQIVVVETRDPRSGAILKGEPGTLQEYPPPPGGRSNALTGPIEIAGAEPGDVLSVEVQGIELAPRGYMAAADLGYVVPDGRIADRKIGIIANHDGLAHWKNGISFPLRPMIGEIGVAHADSPRSGSIGVNGGNLDCILVTTGTRIYLPVQVAGAMLYLGDVHSAMGDGELSCGGVETAADVTVAVELHKNVALPGPRLETADRIVTTGWSRDFSEARRMAVDDMLRLMEAGMRISPVEALMLIGATGDLRIGQSCGNMEMTLRLEMPRLPGLYVLPGSTGLPG